MPKDTVDAHGAHSDAHAGVAHLPIAPMRWSRDDEFFLPGSRAMLNRAAAAESAIMFVHGWGGSAIGTWEAFPACLRAMPGASNADIFFLEYPSRRVSVANCAGETIELLRDLLRAPAKTIVNPSLPPGLPHRDEAWRYARVVVVAHSMGAVVVRRALLDLDRLDLTAQEAKTIRMLFFAPAHRGLYSVPGFIASGLGLDFLPGATLVGQAMRAYYRSLADLERGSDALDLLLMDSKAVRERRSAKQAPDEDLRASVLHARHDKLVVQERFDEDRDGRPIAHGNHRSACKPEAGDAESRAVQALGKLL